MAALRVRSPKFFAWLLWVKRVWYSFGKVRLGILYLLVRLHQMKKHGSMFRLKDPSEHVFCFYWKMFVV